MTTLMFFHVLAGTLSVLAGTTALLTQKGSMTHRAAGNLFFASMLIMALAGSVIAIQIPQMITFIAGLFTCYLVTTAWMTVKNRPQTTHIVDRLSFLAALLLAGLGGYFGYQALNQPDGLQDGFGPGPYFFFAGLAFLAAILDGVYLYKGGSQGKHRIARHLWRMCFALYIAMGSLFTGPGAQIFPQSWRESGLLAIPELAVGIAMIVWLILVLFTQKMFKHPS